MRQKSLLLSTSAILLTAGGVSGWVEPGTAAETRFPTTEVRWWNSDPDEPWQSISFTVPDLDTTVSASGGELRRYDVHIAKMFEVTHYLCQQHNPNYLKWIDETLFSPVSTDSQRLRLLEKFLQNKLGEKGFEWSYGAANDNVDMGRFKISCQLATEIATAYGFAEPEKTTIRDLIRKNGRFSKQYSIPSLNIVGTKVSKWMNFVQSFRPVAFAPTLKLDSPFPVDEVVNQLADKTEIPILLPSRTYLGRGSLIRGDRNSYGITFCAGPSKRPGCDSTASYLGTISANRITESYRSAVRRAKESPEPVEVYPNSRSRGVLLANGLRATFSSICGTYCTANLDWEYQGVRYSIGEKNGNQRDMVAIANSMIEAGPR